MNTLPKKVETLLLEGTPYGLRYHDLANWNGRVFVSPRASLKQLLGRRELEHSGIYLLIAVNHETGREQVYIGEADVLSQRLGAHSQKGFWSEIVVCVAKDDSLDKASARYIESILVEKAAKYKQCDLENGNTPAIKNLSEANIAVMDEFVQNIIFMLSMLGYRLIRPDNKTEDKHSPLLHCSLLGAKATGRETDEGFVVYAYSTARVKATLSWQESGRKLRDKLLEAEVLAPDPSSPDLYFFTQDYVFNSPSQASGIIFARSTNGRHDWENEKGIKLTNLQV